MMMTRDHMIILALTLFVLWVLFMRKKEENYCGACAVGT
jgi:hypothetical protein